MHQDFVYLNIRAEANTHHTFVEPVTHVGNSFIQECSLKKIWKKEIGVEAVYAKLYVNLHTNQMARSSHASM